MHKHKLAPIKKQDRIHTDIDDLFSGERTGHVGYLFYGPMAFPKSDFSEVDYWASNYSTNDYYIPAEEISLISKVIEELSLNVECVIDLGPGEEHALQKKSLPILKAVGAEKYVAVDTTLEYVDNAMRYMNIEAAAISEGHIFNFFDKPLPLSRKNALVFMTGGTVSNLPLDKSIKDVHLYLSSCLKNFRNAVKGKSYFLTGFDANQDIESLTRSYSNRTLCNFFENLMWRFHIQYGYALDPKNFRYKGVWVEQERRFMHCLEVQSDCVVKRAGRSFSLKKGQMLHVENSYKFPPEMMAKAAENAGWKTKKIWTETGRVHYMLFEAV